MNAQELPPQDFLKGMGHIDHLYQELLPSRPKVGGAHDNGHLMRVARGASEIANFYGLSEREVFLTRVAGLFHDWIRDPRESQGLVGAKDEELSAMAAGKFLLSLKDEGMWDGGEDEIEAVHWAITNQGVMPDIFRNAQTREQEPASLHEIVQVPLFVADKMQANGADVIARRSSFVSGERLRSPNGDLKEWGFEPNRDELLVVALESAFRLTHKNPQNEYPERLRPILDPLYDVQREYAHGVMGALGMSVADLARELLVIRKDGQSFWGFRTKQAEDGLEATRLSALLSEVGGLTDEAILHGDTEGRNRSAEEVILFFSSRYEEPVEKVASEWQPSHVVGHRWRELMLESM